MSFDPLDGARSMKMKISVPITLILHSQPTEPEAALQLNLRASETIGYIEVNNNHIYLRANM